MKIDFISFGMIAVFLGVSLSALPSAALAKGGQSSTGGGNVSRLMGRPITYSKKLYGFGFDSVSNSLRSKRFEAYIAGSLKQDLKKEIGSWSDSKILLITSLLPGDLKQRVRTLLTRDRAKLFRDIDATPYIATDDEIFVDSDNKDASTKHELGSPVRYNPTRLSHVRLHADRLQIWDAADARPELKDFKSILLSLFFHEHVRHFGFRDEDYRVGNVMTIAQSPIVVAALQFKGAKFWEKLAYGLVAKAMQPFASQNLLCNTSAGPVACEGIEKKPMKDVLDELPSRLEYSREGLSVPFPIKGENYFITSPWRGQLIKMLNREMYRAGVMPDLHWVSKFLERPRSHSGDPFLGSSFGDFALLSDPEAHWNVTWFPQ